MGDFKILILAYLIGHSPIESQQYFQLQGWFPTMEDCKKELLKTMPDGRYEVLNDFVVKGDLDKDLAIACSLPPLPTTKIFMN